MVLSLLPSSPPLDLLALIRFPGGRVDTRVDFKRGLSNATLDSNRYYIPTVTNHALFDSFTIDSTSRPVVISVFQITVSSKHEGSAEGYFHIRRLKTHVRKLLKDVGHTPPPYIKAQYFLVCPEDDSERRWEMHAGWRGHQEHSPRGCFLSTCSVSPPHGTSHLFTHPSARTVSSQDERVFWFLGLPRAGQAITTGFSTCLVNVIKLEYLRGYRTSAYSPMLGHSCYKNHKPKPRSKSLCISFTSCILCQPAQTLIGGCL